MKSEELKQNSGDLAGTDLYSLPVGDILRSSRLQMKMSVQQVSSALRIKPVYIEALEKGDFERIPGHAYMIGFLKTYAGFLGLQPDRIVQLMQRQTGKGAARPAYTFPVATDDQKVPEKKIILGSAGILFLMILIWNIWNDPSSPSEIPTVPKDLTEQLTPAPKPKAAPQADAANETQGLKTTVEAPVHPVVLKAVGDSWIEIKDSAGKPIFSRVLKKGEEYWVPSEDNNHTMTTGNAGGLVIVVEGQEMQPMGRRFEVMRNQSLNPDKLKGRLKPKPASSTQ